MILILGAFFLAFCLGSIPFGVLIARLFKAGNIQDQGSGNIGATNVSRVLGFWPAGFLTLFLDVTKGFLPVFLFLPKGFSLWSEWFSLEAIQWERPLYWCIGLFAVLGHCFSPWLKGKGGKGVATFFGVVATLAWIPGLIGLAVFGWVFYSRRLGSLSSLSAVGAVLLSQYVLPGQEDSLWVLALLCAVVVIRHEQNIKDLLEDRERSF